MQLYYHGCSPHWPVNGLRASPSAHLGIHTRPMVVTAGRAVPRLPHTPAMTVPDGHVGVWAAGHSGPTTSLLPPSALNRLRRSIIALLSEVPEANVMLV